MEHVDQKFTQLFMIAPETKKALASSSQRLWAKDERPERRSSMKKRILGILQSAKPLKESARNPPQKLRRMGNQSVERIVPVEMEVRKRSKKETVADERSASPGSNTCPHTPKSCPPVSMDRYPQMRRFTLQDEIFTLERPTHHSAQELFTAKAVSMPHLVAMSNIISEPRYQSPASTQRFSFQASSRDPSPSPSTTSSRRFSLQSFSKSRDKSPSPSTKSLSRRFSFGGSKHKTNTQSLREEEDIAATPQTVVVHPPHNLSTQALGAVSSVFGRKSKAADCKSESSDGDHDSKFSSASSPPSLKSSYDTPRSSATPSPTMVRVVISPAGFRVLDSTTRRIKRRIQEHQYHLDFLGMNLWHLFAKKFQHLKEVDDILKSRGDGINKGYTRNIFQMRMSLYQARNRIGNQFKKRSTVVEKTARILARIQAAINAARGEFDGNIHVVELDALLSCQLREYLEYQGKFDDNLHEILTSTKAEQCFHYKNSDRREINQVVKFAETRGVYLRQCYTKIEALEARLVKVARTENLPGLAI